jgi:hypothetical protein
MKKRHVLGLLALSTFASGLAHAQFGLPSVPGIGGSKSAGGAQADLGGQQASLVKNFVAANIDVLKANAKMSEALGLKSQAATAEATVQQLSSGSTVDKDSASKAAIAVADTGGAIQAELAKKPALDAAAKATYAQGLASLATGVVRYTGLGKDVENMGQAMKSASPTQLPSLGAATYVVSNFPKSASELSKSLKNAIDFAKSNGIEVPAEATAALASL